jgi:hypothetical protein
LRTERFVKMFAPVLLLLTAASPVLADDASTLVGTTIAGIACSVVVLLVLAGCGIYALYFLYTDAEARGGNGVMWLLIGVLASWPVALIIWLAIRPPKRVEGAAAATESTKP